MSHETGDRQVAECAARENAQASDDPGDAAEVRQMRRDPCENAHGTRDARRGELASDRARDADRRPAGDARGRRGLYRRWCRREAQRDDERWRDRGQQHERRASHDRDEPNEMARGGRCTSEQECATTGQYENTSRFRDQRDGAGAEQRMDERERAHGRPPFFFALAISFPRRSSCSGVSAFSPISATTADSVESLKNVSTRWRTASRWRRA